MRALTLFLLTATLALSGCGSSSDDSSPNTQNGNGNGSTNGNGSSNGTNGNGGDRLSQGYNLPALSGLTGDANYQGALFFTATGEGEAGLYRVQPGDAAPTVDLIDDRLAEGLRPMIISIGDNDLEMPPMISPSEYDRFFRSIPAGDFEPSTGVVTDFRVGQIFYNYGLSAETRGYHRLDVGTPEPVPVRVTGDDIVSPLFQAFIQNDLNQSAAAAILNRVGSDWRHIRLDTSGDTASEQLPGNWQPVAPLADPDAARGLGYLVINQGDEDRLMLIDMSLEVIGEVNYRTGGQVDNVGEASPMGLTAPDGSLLLAVADKDTEASESDYARLWRYYPDEEGGELVAITNAGGDGLYLPHALLGLGIAIPQENFIVIDGNDTYFLQQAPGLFALGFDIIHLSDESWNTVRSEELTPGNALLKAGGHLVYSNAAGQIISIDTQGNDRRILDRNDPDNMFSSQDVSFFTQGTRDGWVFYNRDEQVGINEDIQAAVATRADGSERIDIHHAQWIGLSHNGQANFGDGLNALTPSEVFLLREAGDLVAVSAADPGAGGVTLGALPEGNNAVQMFGAGPGPHRLLNAYTRAGNTVSDINVIVVDTRSEQSLMVVSPSTDDNANQRPLGGF